MATLLGHDLSRWAPLSLRLMLGGGLAYHGGIKLFASGGHENITSMIAALGLPAAGVFGWITGLVECGGGLLMLFGLLVRPAAGVNALNMIALLVLAALHGGIPAPLPGGDPLPGFEFAGLILAGTVSLLLTGGGALSLDSWRAAHR